MQIQRRFAPLFRSRRTGRGSGLQAALRQNLWDRVSRLRRLRRLRNGATLSLVVLGPLLAAATYMQLGPLAQGSGSTGLRLILLADLVYFLLLAGLVLSRLLAIVAARKRRSAGSALHARLIGVFGGIALVPTILVAIFAGLTVNIGLEGWFSERVGSVVRSSLAAAVAYKEEHRRDLIQDATALGGYLNLQRQAAVFMDDGDLRELLTAGQAGIQRGLREAYVIDTTGVIRARGERSYLFNFETPSAADITSAQEEIGVHLIEDPQAGEFRALLKLDAFVDRYLYVSRAVDGELLALLDETQETVGLYQQLESTRGKVLFEFGLVYIGFALILILAAIWLGLWFAERLSKPIGRLALAAELVGRGDLDARVIEAPGEDEISTLGRNFNTMTRQLKAQRAELVESHRESDERRRLFDSVLGSVTSGVVALDAEGRIDFINRAASQILELHPVASHDRDLGEVIPEFVNIYNRLRDNLHATLQEEVRLSRGGRLESVLLRIAVRMAGEQVEGYVLAFDDVTELVSAQRMAAWGDVARRIAHEIKNPLTPIALSAERIKRKFSKGLGEEERASLEQYSDVIIRQTNDLRRIVDEFSRFARMPEPDRRDHDIAALLRDAVTLQEAGLAQGPVPEVRLISEIAAEPVVVELDATMIGQAFTNLIKNALEALESLQERGAPQGWEPRVTVALEARAEQVVIRITDNGIGLPPDRARLFEPYVTTRAKGTGLGLPIVKKIIEEHGGSLTLTDAPHQDAALHEPRALGAQTLGARAEIRLPRARIVARAVKDRSGPSSNQTAPHD